jgi:uncharacterized protein (TIGR02246 family)
MQAKVLLTIIAGVCLAFQAVNAAADQAADEATIRANAAKYVEAYNRRDAKAMASMWSPEAVYMSPATGEEVVGRDAIAKQIEDSFASAEDGKLSVHINSIDFVSPNVAVEKGTSEVTYSKSKPDKTDYTAVHVRRDGKWQLDRISEVDVPAPPPSNYEHLKELDWMIGSWIDKDDRATVQTDCEWTKNRNFMTRSFAVVIGDRVNMSGMQVVGWDPVAKQIRSWVFDSNGGYSDGKWTHKGNKWFVEQTGTLPDGGKTSAVNIFTHVDNNSFTWQSIDRTIDGEVQPNVDEVLIVRKPAE